MSSMIRTMIEICLLRSGPQHLKHSLQLLLFLLVLALLLSVISHRIITSEDYDPLELLIFAYYTLMPFLILRQFGLSQRFMQTLTAMAGTGIIISLVMLPLILHFKSQQAINQYPSLLLVIAWYLTLFWNLIVEAHIYQHALNRSFHFGMVITLSLLFWQSADPHSVQFLGNGRMNLHFLGICGTFMGSLARLAKQQGNRVSGADQNVYPPMSDQLEAEGIVLTEGYDPEGIPADTDLIIVGNALSRGNRSVEYLLDNNLAYTSGPQWLAEHVLCNLKVIAIAGTHGKTTTSSLLAWILEHAGLNPSFLIGGVPGNFGVSSRLTESEWFVIEADEYDTAFFDKRSKFVHYRPFIQVLNNLEFDHADIFNSIDEIKTQFHHLIRVVPQSGHIIHNADDQHLEDVLNRGCWSARHGFSSTSTADWHGHIDAADGSSIEITAPNLGTHVSDWPLQGQHNLMNCIAATAAAHCAGISPEKSLEAIRQFRGIKRRMECLHESGKTLCVRRFCTSPDRHQTDTGGLPSTLAGARTCRRPRAPQQHHAHGHPRERVARCAGGC